jgi:copper(I)-binding protein
MRRYVKSLVLAVGWGLVALPVAAQDVAHTEPPTETIEVVANVTGVVTAADAYAYPSLGLKRPGVAFVTLHNTSDAQRELVAVRAEEWSDRVELHEHTNVKGVMMMQQVASITVPAHGSVELKPGGYHMMLMGLKKPLRAKDTITLVLSFDDKSELQVPAVIRTR